MNILRINKQQIVEIALSLFVFVLLVDPADVILGVKIPLFAFVLLSILLVGYKGTKQTIFLPIISYLVIGITSVVGVLYQYNTDYDFLLFFALGFLMLFLLYWAKDIRVIEKCVFPGVTIAIIVSLIYNYFYLSGISDTSIVYDIINKQYKGTLMISARQFLGVEVATVYYSSAPVLLIIFGYYYHKLLNELNRRNIIIVLALAMPLLIGGTRMLFLSLLGIIYSISIFKLWNSKYRRTSILFSLLGVFSLVFIVILFLSDKGESSLDNKTVLFNAFINHISIHPETLLFGNGVGATFDSLGVRGISAIQSEWTYLEFIRWFGLPLGMCFLSIYIYPIYLIIKRRKELFGSGAILISYLFYLVLAGTNPYLYSSNGMLSLLIMYSYALNPHYRVKRIE